MHFSICDFILDCVQNAVEADAERIFVELIESPQTIAAEVKDNGAGMSRDELRLARDPFFTTGKKHRNRKVGLGLPFLMQAVEMTGGEFTVESEKYAGTVLRFSFPVNHVDTPPLGNPADMCLQAFIFQGGYELEFRRERRNIEQNQEYRVTRSECLEAAGGLADSFSLKLLREYLRSQEEDIRLPVSKS